ncbi:hypothetical protein [Deinococcus sp.]|uniref:hypothetical protein n=1 Tax=Deinococcus sp. TaxID=47478 RepID=UPI00286981DC|nr:hypothetical protein [Deinococcus sp.]
MKVWPVALVLASLGAGFVLGRSGTPASLVPVRAVSAKALTGILSMSRPMVRSVVDQAHDDPVNGDPVGSDPREVIPLIPGTGQQPGAGPQPPGQGPGQGECTVLMFKDGQFYRLQPGTPAPGTTPQSGLPGGDSELFPVQPQQTPSPDAPQFPGSESRT